MDDERTGDSSRGAPNEELLLRLPDTLRGELKAPFGPVETDAETLLERAPTPIVAVGDVVTYHLLEAGCVPAVAVVDGYTERERVDDVVYERVTDGERTLEATNPPAGLSASLLEALAEALAEAEPTTVLVDGEEDLAALPAILAAPAGASVVYGQPGEGMVYVAVTDESRAAVRDLLERFEGDHERAFALLGVA
ncbi:GTP-dependent dephospho-CoA kinase family protein [Natronobiforma cellulositropha]|uniref:GTP-dependent dephospho-CoA kinase family protein n=1 Tax=Natronobiforma cellulositropha TaxID=1679076 RepID=UPI0021D5E028|nr:DUF359 domain-containing protein [Natronobiforma cellulositropha]